MSSRANALTHAQRRAHRIANRKSGADTLAHRRAFGVAITNAIALADPRRKRRAVTRAIVNAQRKSAAADGYQPGVPAPDPIVP